MYRVLFLAHAALLTALAQSLVDAEHRAKARATFRSAAQAPTLKCQFAEIPPALNFALRFQTGFSVQLPVQQFQGPGHGWDVLLRVTPDGKEPVLLTTS